MKLKNLGRIDYDNENYEPNRYGGDKCIMNKYTPDKVWTLRSPNPGPTDFRQKILVDNYGDDFIDKVEKVLEIGCGCGRNAQFFINETEHIKYYGFDTSFVGLEYLKKQGFDEDRYYVSTDIDDVILSQKYDLIFNTYVFHHIGFVPEDNKKEYYDSISITKKLFPLLKVGGYWVSHEGFSGDNGWNNKRWFSESFNENSIELKKLVPNAGLEGGPDKHHDLYIIKKIS